MAPIVKNCSSLEDDNVGWKTYYLRILYNSEWFYKIGRCKGSVRARFSKEANDLIIEILQIWKHSTASDCEAHEYDLFSKNTGDRPYFGKCGPLSFGGNTEVFSHDVMRGEPSPKSFIAKMLTNSRYGLLVRGYPDRNPLLSFRHLIGQYRYMDTMLGPPDIDEGVFLQVPTLSAPGHVVIATVDWLESLASGKFAVHRSFTRKLASETLELSITVRFWEDYKNMRFWGKGFRVSRFDDWY